MATKEWHREWRRKNPEKSKLYQARYKERHPGAASAATEKWRKKNPVRHLDTVKRYQKRVRDAVFAAYGEVCVCCGETAREFLSIDHINGDGAAHRRELAKGRKGGSGSINLYVFLKKSGFPKDNFRILCMNCNWSRGKYGYCPHERALTLVK